MNEIMQLLNDCVDRESKLNDWENGFISSLVDQVEEGRRLSDNQISKLNGIWDKVTEDG